MKCWVFSIGEPTTDLCCELLKEYGFEVILLQDDTTLQQKLKRFYIEASGEDEAMRIDADIIPNKSILNMDNKYGWTCASGFDWYKQSEGAISIHIMQRNVIKLALASIDEAVEENRPESFIWRLSNINIYTSIDDNHIYGIHGYGQKSHRERIKALKDSRNQEYDWGLVQKIEAL